MKPRVFVGTMHAGERDFERCCEMVRAQADVTVTHYIISGLPERAAHEKLFSTWNDEKDKHDLFVKVDADTVLIDETLVSRVYEEFSKNEKVTGLQAPLHDFFTDRFINGLNAFSPRVVFSMPKSELYCDRVDSNHSEEVKGSRVPESLKPAGLHCFYADEKQAFHFGLHRALKMQHDVIQNVRAVWLRERDVIRAFALLGALQSHAFVGKLHVKFNYGDEEFERAFEQARLHLDDFQNTIEVGS